jgi:hypothetical protein
MIFWKHGKIASAQRRLSVEDFRDSLDTILLKAPDEMDWAT